MLICANRDILWILIRSILQCLTSRVGRIVISIKYNLVLQRFGSKLQEVTIFMICICLLLLLYLNQVSNLLWVCSDGNFWEIMRSLGQLWWALSLVDDLRLCLKSGTGRGHGIQWASLDLDLIKALFQQLILFGQIGDPPIQLFLQFIQVFLLWLDISVMLLDQFV